MMLSVVRHTYDCKKAAELAYERRPKLMRYIQEQLRLKHVNEAYVCELTEDVLQDGITLLLSTQYECANADEAITEAMSRAVQAAARDINARKEVSETLCITDTKEGDRELSRFDKAGISSSSSAEEIYFEQIDVCTLEEAVERIEAVRYIYGFDIVLTLLLRAGILKKLWHESRANGLLAAYDSAIPVRKYSGDVGIARVISAAAYAEPEELIKTMRTNLSCCDKLLAALGYCVT